MHASPLRCGSLTGPGFSSHSWLLAACLLASTIDPRLVDAQTAGAPLLVADTKLSIDGDILECSPPGAGIPPCGLIAGKQIISVSLVVDNKNYFPKTGLGSAAFTFVNTSVSKAALLADPSLCRPMGPNVVGPSVLYSASGTWASASGAGTVLLPDLDSEPLQMSLKPAEVPLEFRMGGQFKLCYSQDGSFGQAKVADVLEQVIMVWGVYDKRDECKRDDTCMRTKRHRCYVLKGAFNNMANTYAAGSSCVVDYTYEGAGFEGSKKTDAYPKYSWSESFSATYTEAGVKTSTGYKVCGSKPANFLCHSTTAANCTPGDYKTPAFVGAAGVLMKLPPSINWLGNNTVPRYAPRTLAACYCPFDLCIQDKDFKQQVGLLMYYVTKVCYTGLAGEIDCDDDFLGAAPQHRFSMRLLCPPDGCGGATQSRIKLVAQSADNDKPSWATSTGSSVTGCATARHGYNAQGKYVLPADDNPQVEVITGRGRNDFKIWNWKRYKTGGILLDTNLPNPGFMFNMGFTDHEKRSGGGVQPVGGETFDVCYCDDACAVGGNWFKAGQLRFVPLQLVSSAQNTSSHQEDFVIEYANQPGMLGFYRTPADRGIMGLQDGAMVKLVRDLAVNITDAGCKDDPDLFFDPKYDRNLVWPGPMIDYYYKTAYGEYQGLTNKTIDPNKLIFNNGTLQNRITVKKAGFLAVCYCSGVENGVCLSNGWVLAMRLMIRGPREAHAWRVSTNVVFRLELEGWGLSNKDMLRIVPATSSCSVGGDDIYGPRGTYTVTNIKLRCPYPCAEVGEPTSALNGGIEVNTLSDSRWKCDVQNGDCRNNDIKTVFVLNDHATEIEFEKEHGLSDGDIITLTDNYQCHHNDTLDECNEVRLEVLRGQFRFADNILKTQPANASAYYYSGHIVTLHATDTTKITIPVGWPTAPLRPRFVVKSANNKRGRWLRHSKAISKLEIMGTRAYEGLRVCWAYPTPTGYPKYTTQVGTISLEDANTMQNARISLTSLVKGQRAPWAPFVFSFTTAGSETGKQYSRVQGPTRLRILFTASTSSVYATFGDGGSIDVNSGEDEVQEAKQYICGKIFRELWGSDPDIGFPMPRGCYYTVYGVAQELNMVFDAKNGLKAGQDYQMVMTGVAMDGATADKKYAEIYTMDDILLKPYSSIERGLVLLMKSPMNPAYGTDGVELLSPDGAKVVSSTAPDMMELQGSNTVKIAFRGQPSGGGIKASSVLRLFLWPLTQWNVAGRCTAQCTAHDIVTHPCGAVQDCRGDSLIPNSFKNYIRIVLPATMATMTDEVSHALTISGWVFPKGGFFPTRFGVELRRPDDTKPHYLETVGIFFFKEPDDGASVGKLVEFYGDGDQKPFKGDQGNVYYASIMLASTVFAALQSNDAIMEIMLPEGYECLYPPSDPGVSPWQAPSNLNVFGDTVPQGTGHPFESSAWSGVNNTCKYSLRQNGVIYAGSALTIKINVNNPPYPLKRTDGRNRWKVQLTSKGYYSYQLTFPPVVFGSDASAGNYSSNKPVLGQLTEARIVPQMFAASADSINVQMTWVRIFFRTEQDSGVDAQIRIVAPAGFQFPDPCTLRDIPLSPFNYYAAYAIGIQKPTKRLPGILKCTHVMWPGETTPSHVAGTMSGQFLADTYYGFETYVQNAVTYDRLGTYTWRLFTTDGIGNRVDGTRMEGLVEEQPTFGLYRMNLADVRAVMSPGGLLPSGIAGPAWVELTIKVPAGMDGVNSMLRVLAPAGFVWNTSDFLQQNIGAPSSSSEKNMLLWDAQVYQSSKTYAFRSTIHVPDASPGHSVNEFLFEFGHIGNTLATRHAAGRLMVEPVKAVVAADVDFYQITNLRDPPNELSFQFETITDIPAGGGFHITGPPGFVIATQGGKRCTPMAAQAMRGSPYEVLSEICCMKTTCTHLCPDIKLLPADTKCEVKSLDYEAVVLDLTAGPTGMPAGRYRFALQALNPSEPMANEANESAQCGKQYCWAFNARTNITSPENISDAPSYAPAFPILKKMVEAGISEITDMQVALSGRDDRPLFENSLVFFFKLTQQMIEKEVLSIRAPQGYLFREDCLSALEVRGNEVYGSGQTVADGDTMFPSDVKILGCRGEGPNAFIFTDPGFGLGFKAGLRYPFRLKVTNPRIEPLAADNRWIISYGAESSRPFDGFSLWTFKRTLVPPVPVSIGASAADSSLMRLWNPVTFTFAPHNTLMGSGMSIVVTAPPNFQIANEMLKSRAMVQPVSEVPGAGVGDIPPDPKYDSRPSMIWGDAELDCQVDQATKRTVRIIVLSDMRELTAGRDYQLTIFVYNPMTTVEVSRQNEWTLQTFNSKASSPVLPLFRDYIALPGFRIEDTARTWMLKNEEPSTGLSLFNGLQRVKQLYMEMQMPSKLQSLKAKTPADFLVIESPAGYEFVDCAGTFQWEPPKDFDLYLPASPRTCYKGNGPMERSNMTIKIQEPLDIPAMRVIKFRIDVKNSAKTPHVMLNHWIITHYNGLSGKIMSTAAYLSWNIIPQLANPFIQLIGDNVNKAAGTKSRMAISFVPINDADQLEVWAKLPAGFDFTGCQALTEGHEIVTTTLDKVRVRASVFAGLTANIVIDGFKLGQIGGPTTFDLQTKLNNGEKMDEALAFTGGFVLPGNLKIIGQSIIDSKYAMNPKDYPGERNVRMMALATVKFRIVFTRQAEPGDLIAVSSQHYTMLPANFLIGRLPSGAIVSAEVVSYVDGTIVAQLRGTAMQMTVPGFENPSYEVSCSVRTPNLPRPEDSNFRIDLQMPGSASGKQLPLNTNDGRDVGFRLVENVQLEMSKPPSNEAPPMAEVTVEMKVDPRSTKPDELYLMAPLLFNFTEDCLVRRGTGDVIKSCQFWRMDASGRAVARILTKAGGLTAATDYVVIRIITPGDNPAEDKNKVWFIDARESATGLQVGWGEDPVGLSIRQMSGAQVVFSGVPQVSGQMSVQFYSPDKVDEGGKIRVIYPRSIAILCDGAFFSRVSIEGDVTCYNNGKEGRFDIEMKRPMPPGLQAFTVTATPPDSVDDPGGNIFKILIYTKEGKVVDAAMSILGDRIHHGLTVSALPLIWSASDPGRQTSISVGFELLADMPEKDPPIMSEIVVTVPETFEQVVTRASNIEMLGDPLPLRPGMWLAVKDPRRLKILLDERATRTLAMGRYRFSFPAMVPTKMPKYNVFQVTICGPNPPGKNDTCTGEPQDPRALTTFPLAGFALGESNPVAKQYMAAASPGRRRTAPAGSWLPALSVLLLGVFSRSLWP